VTPIGVAILAMVSVSGAGEASATAMADRALATAAHVTIGANGSAARTRESCGSRCDPLEPGLVDRPGETGLVAVMVTSCAREARFPSSSQRTEAARKSADTAVDAQRSPSSCRRAPKPIGSVDLAQE